MKPGDLRRFKDRPEDRLEEGPGEGSTFMVLRVNDSASCAPPRRAVDILLDGRVETDLGYSWVEDSSEVINEAG